MIRKPDARVFQDSTTVKAVRGAQLVVGEGSKSLARTVSGLWMGLILLVFITTGLGAMVSATSPFRMLLCAVLVGGAIWLLVRLFRGPTRKQVIEQTDEYGLPVAAEIPQAAPSPRAIPTSSRPGEAIQVRYWPQALFHKAFTLAIAGIILTVMSNLFAIVGVLLIARGVLLIAAGFGERKCLDVGGATVTVHNMLGSKTMALAEIETAFLHKFKPVRQDVSCLVGSRKVILVSGRTAGERCHLMIPYSLLGMSDEAADDLCQELLARVGGAPAQAPRPPVAPSYQDTPEPTFDPDAIMARYLAERDHLQQDSKMPPVGSPQPRVGGFGRKGLRQA